MTNACPIPTAAEAAYGTILGQIEDELMRRVHAALEDAAARARSEIEAAGLGMRAPDRGYFAAIVHQHMYCTICGADPKTFAGGRADAAIAVIRNSQNIARHHWGATIEPDPRA